MKRTLSTLSLLLSVLVAMEAKAYDIVVDGIYYNVDGTEASVSNNGHYNNYSGDIVIPSSFEYGGTTYTVTSIGRAAFGFCDGLTSVVVPESVTSIEDSAFLNCRNLGSATIPASVDYVGESAFEETAWYESMPDGIVYIGNSLYTFKSEDPSQLTSLDIAEGTKSISPYALSRCENLSSVTIPATVTRIGGYAFYECRRLTSLELPYSLTEIGQGAFSSCSGIKYLSLPNSLKVIGDYAFSNCLNLTSIAIPNSVSYIGSDAFARCNNLASVRIGNTTISYQAFCDSKNVTAIVICDSVTSIDNRAFEGLDNLSEVTVGWEVPLEVSDSDSIFYNTDIKKCTLYVPKGTASLYNASEVWKDFGSIVEKEASAVNDIYSDEGRKVIGVYDTAGRRISASQRGINIIRYEDGTAVKVLRK